jgi:nonsense-mediated mRNA decay protein 3
MKERRRGKEKWSKFCPKCGKKTDELFDSLCKECFINRTRLIEADLKVSISVCKNCGGYFKGKEKTSIEEAVADSVKKEIRKKYGYGGRVEIKGLRKELKADENRASVFLVAKAEIKGVEIEERGEVEVILKQETCERCSRIAGGYYEGIVQIRAENRIPTEEELVMAEKIAYSSVGEADFVSKERKLKEGVDVYVSSMECGRRISRQIVKKLGGVFSESRKLYGRKDGRNIYRVSFSVRLPELEEGAKTTRLHRFSRE